MILPCQTLHLPEWRKLKKLDTTESRAAAALVPGADFIAMSSASLILLDQIGYP
jgi:hypothetical protein